MIKVGVVADSGKGKGKEGLGWGFWGAGHVSIFFFLSYLFIYFGLPPGHVRSYFPLPGIESVLFALDAQSLNHWTTRKVPMRVF